MYTGNKTKKCFIWYFMTTKKWNRCTTSMQCNDIKRKSETKQNNFQAVFRIIYTILWVLFTFRKWRLLFRYLYIFHTWLPFSQVLYISFYSFAATINIQAALSCWNMFVIDTFLSLTSSAKIIYDVNTNVHIVVLNITIPLHSAQDALLQHLVFTEFAVVS